MRCCTIKLAIPLLHVSDSAAAKDFYCKQLGFRLEFAHHPDGVKADPCYMGVTCDGVWLHLSSFPGDGVLGGVANLFVDDVDTLHAELVAKGVRIDTGPVDQTWAPAKCTQRTWMFCAGPHYVPSQ